MIVVDGPYSARRSGEVVDRRRCRESGDVLAAKNAHAKLRPASTLKTLTAITLLPRLNLHDTYRVRWEDAHVTGSAVGIVPGSRYTIDQLFYGLMLPSGNDAARALASANGGLPVTVRQMNAKAAVARRQVTRSAVNPTGLDAPGQHTSAFDLAIFAREGLTDRDFSTVRRNCVDVFPRRGAEARPEAQVLHDLQPEPTADRRVPRDGRRQDRLHDASRPHLRRRRPARRTHADRRADGNHRAVATWLRSGCCSGDGRTVSHVTPVGSLDEPKQISAQPSKPAEPSPSAAAQSALASLPPTPTMDPDPVCWSVALAGAALIAGGWWLQRRRRPRRVRNAGHG